MNKLTLFETGTNREDTLLLTHSFFWLASALFYLAFTHSLLFFSLLFTCFSLLPSLSLSPVVCVCVCVCFLTWILEIQIFNCFYFCSLICRIPPSSNPFFSVFIKSHIQSSAGAEDFLKEKERNQRRSDGFWLIFISFKYNPLVSCEFFLKHSRR